MHRLRLLSYSEKPTWGTLELVHPLGQQRLSVAPAGAAVASLRKRSHKSHHWHSCLITLAGPAGIKGVWEASSGGGGPAAEAQLAGG